MKEIEVRKRENLEPEKSNFIIDFNIQYAIKRTSVEEKRIQELQKYYSVPPCDIKRTCYNGGEFPILSLITGDFFSIPPPPTSLPAEPSFLALFFSHKKKVKS